jgi:PAS domain-containing protein
LPTDAERRITDANPVAEQILGLSLSQLQGKTSMDPRWKAIHEDGSDFPGENHPIPVALKTRKTVKNVIHGVFHPVNEEYRWISVNTVPKFRKRGKHTL